MSFHCFGLSVNFTIAASGIGFVGCESVMTLGLTMQVTLGPDQRSYSTDYPCAISQH
jgi:hypothetical protein